MAEVEEILNLLNIEITGTSVSRVDGHTEFSARCPFHFGGARVEHNPSWTINADTGAHVCHGCGFTGGLATLLRTVAGLDDEAIAKMVDRGERALERLRRLDPWGGEKRVEIQPMDEARIKMYGLPPDRALRKRRLTAEAAARYGVRWADVFRKREDGKWAEYENCWITPIRHAQTYTAMGMQVKQEGGRFFRNLPGSVQKSTTLFGIDAVGRSNKQLHVLESPLDAVYASRLGFPAVATMGADISTTQINLLIEITDVVILALDNDEAGWKTVYRLLGLNPDGSPNRRYLDYSRLTNIRITDYSDIDGKDVGEQIPSVARSLLHGHRPASSVSLTC